MPQREGQGSTKNGQMHTTIVRPPDARNTQGRANAALTVASCWSIRGWADWASKRRTTTQPARASCADFCHRYCGGRMRASYHTGMHGTSGIVRVVRALRRRPRQGFTVVEAVLAMVIIAIALAGTGAAQGWAGRMFRQARAATEQMEGPRRIVSQFAQWPAASMPTSTQVYLLDSLRITASPVASTSAGVPRFEFIVAAQKGIGTSRPDTFRLDFSAFVTAEPASMASASLGDYRP